MVATHKTTHHHVRHVQPQDHWLCRAPIVSTLALDTLAALGTGFTAAYTPSPICVPARPSFGRQCQWCARSTICCGSASSGPCSTSTSSYLGCCNHLRRST